MNSRLSLGCNSSIASTRCFNHTYRSVKAIQSKIYQIKPDFEKEADELDNVQEKLL